MRSLTQLVFLSKFLRQKIETEDFYIGLSSTGINILIFTSKMLTSVIAFSFLFFNFSEIQFRIMKKQMCSVISTGWQSAVQLQMSSD